MNTKSFQKINSKQSMYPPKHHIETDINKIYQVIQAYPFASLISQAKGEVLVTQLPLMLDAMRGDKGVLIGHIDKNNPHSQNLDLQNITVLFHGPDCYISPTVYSSKQLPTWNYITVEVKGTAITFKTNNETLDSIENMTRTLETGDNPYVINRDEKRIQSLIDYIVGFEITIESLVGRFKLSQDKSGEDTQLAKEKLIKRSSHSHAELINSLLDK